MKKSGILLSIMGALASLGGSLTASMTPVFGEDPKVHHHETPVGAGYWAERHNVSTGGVKYTKLVPRVRGRELTRKQVKANSKLWRDEAEARYKKG